MTVRPLENNGLTPSEIETGRKLFAGEWVFVAGAASAEALPPPGRIEIAFAAR